MILPEKNNGMQFGWSSEVTGTLISLLGEANGQKLDDMSTNHTMYKEIANSIREAGYDYS